MERPVLGKRKKEKKLERERSFLNGNAFLSVPVPTNFGQRTSLGAACALAFLQRRSACSHAREQTYHANWSLGSPRHKCKPRTSLGAGGDLTWSNGWAATSAHLDLIAKQYKRGARTGVERGKNGFGTGSRTGLEMGKNRVGTGAKRVLNGIKMESRQI